MGHFRNAGRRKLSRVNFCKDLWDCFRIGKKNWPIGSSAAKMSLLKWIRVFSNFVALIPVCWKCQMKANFPGVDFLGPHSSFERERKIRCHLFTSSIKCEIRDFHAVVVQWRKEMYKKVCCTCKVVVLLIKPIACLTFSLLSPAHFGPSLLLVSKVAYWVTFNMQWSLERHRLCSTFKIWW